MKTRCSNWGLITQIGEIVNIWTLLIYALTYIRHLLLLEIEVTKKKNAYTALKFEGMGVAKSCTLTRLEVDFDFPTPRIITIVSCVDHEKLSEDLRQTIHQLHLDKIITSIGGLSSSWVSNPSYYILVWICLSRLSCLFFIFLNLESPCTFNESSC